MSLPSLNDRGELPLGVHRATLQEVLATFGEGTDRRREIGLRLAKIWELALRTNSLSKMVVFGSFTTNKREPGDVDVILIMRDEFELDACTEESRLLFDHERAEAELGASVFWIRPCHLILESLDDFVAIWQGKRGGGKRGIVEITP
jgi:hypothetical protein